MNRPPVRRAILPVVVATVFLLAGREALALNGNQLALRSSGVSSGTDWVLSENGYVGTYVTLAAPGDVTINVNAAGLAGGGVDPNMNVVVDDSRTSFDVTAGFNSYQATVSLPAGTHFVRTEFNNDVPSSSRQLTVRSLDVAGATIANSDTDANALAASDTYIQNFRKGPAHLSLVGATPGSQLSVQLKSHDFNFGGAVTGFSAATTLNNAAYSAFLQQNFNMLVGTNAGKWQVNEGTRDVVDMTYFDQILNYAQAHGMRARAHNLIWGDQQPTFVNTMLSNPNGPDANPPTGTGSGNTNKLGLYGAVNGSGQGISELSERINAYTTGYVGGVVDPNNQRADKYTEMDVYNEPVHTGVNRANSYWTVYGAAGISKIIDETAQAMQAAGSSAKLYVNEYNILQNGTDSYGNWYRQYIDTIQNADGNPANGPISGVDMEDYALPGHSAAYMQQVLQNMSVEGLPLSIGEFGVQDNLSITSDDQSESEVIRTVTEAMKMMYGTPQATTFMYWGWSTNLTSDLQRASALVDGTYMNLTDVGKAYQDLLGIHDWDGDPNDGWTTNLSLPVNADGTIDFTGFYGDYDVTIDGKTYSLSLAKGSTSYSLVISLPADFNHDGTVDGADLAAWQASFDTGAGGDANGDGVTDGADFLMWQQQLGLHVTAPKAASFASHPVPEPATIVISAVMVLAAGICRRLGRRR